MISDKMRQWHDQCEVRMGTQRKLDTGAASYYFIGATICTILFLWYSGGISGNDFWWHIKIGEWILENKEVPTTGIYSWYALEEGLPWISHEWLSEVILYAAYRLAGSFGIWFLSAFSALLLFALIMRRNREEILKNTGLAAFFLLFTIVIFPVYFYGRPQIFSVFLLFATVYCLYGYYERSRPKAIYWLPLISVLWSNLHGGSANLPYFLTIILLFSGLIEIRHERLENRKWSRHESLTLLAVAGASMISTAISPHGLKMIAYPYVNMGDLLMLMNIREWASPDAKSLLELILCFFPILFVSLVFLLSKNKIRLFDLLLFLLFCYLTFRSVRFILLFYIVAGFFVFRYLPERKEMPSAGKLFKGILAVSCCVLLALNVYGSVRTVELFKGGEPIAVVLDDKYVELVKETDPARLFNDYGYGETLIYHGIHTFIDGRADIYSKHNYRDVVLLQTLQAPKGEEMIGAVDIEGIIRKYDFDAFLVMANRSLSTYLLSHPEKFTLLLGDENTLYFVRTTGDISD